MLKVSTYIIFILLPIFTQAALPPKIQKQKDAKAMLGFVLSHPRILKTINFIDFDKHIIYYDRNCTAIMSYAKEYRPIGWVGPASPLVFESSTCSINEYEGLDALDAFLTPKPKGVEISIAIHKKIKKVKVPATLSLDDDNELLLFAYKKLHLEKKNIKIQRYEHYIILHYHNKEYIQAHPEWEGKQYGEAMVIDTDTMMYNLFRLAGS